METCASCRFWERGGAEASLGYCLRYAPRPHTTPEMAPEMDTYWPQTLDDEWCGEWVERPPIDPDERKRWLIDNVDVTE